MSARLEDAVELLDRSLAYTRVVLADVGTCAHADPAAYLSRSTPCVRWQLGDLLDHLADSLDAFTDAAAGAVPLRPARIPVAAGEPVACRVAGLQQQAAALLAAWAACAPEVVAVGAAPIGGPLLGEAAALEIAVHGWDVSRATGHGAPLPEDLAGRLLEVAHAVLTEADRGGRFAPARPARGPSYADRLLAFLGRS